MSTGITGWVLHEADIHCNTECMQKAQTIRDSKYNVRNIRSNDGGIIVARYLGNEI
ncbi:hypothetical protein SLEP1_g7477 [Rubroshorea leprosula]|uniref:Uncharacterized protein n=1 Tax=Rubroshorea leprosula TaxID=152421 RepID=A0AAV5I339_9ROSI|nr:hypothetical protein SLEP1_g7477 [Rubroshorea leprosula]